MTLYYTLSKLLVARFNDAMKLGVMSVCMTFFFFTDVSMSTNDLSAGSKDYISGIFVTKTS